MVVECLDNERTYIGDTFDKKTKVKTKGFIDYTQVEKLKNVV